MKKTIILTIACLATSYAAHATSMNSQASVGVQKLSKTCVSTVSEAAKVLAKAVVDAKFPGHEVTVNAVEVRDAIPLYPAAVNNVDASVAVTVDGENDTVDTVISVQLEKNNDCKVKAATVVFED